MTMLVLPGLTGAGHGATRRPELVPPPDDGDKTGRRPRWGFWARQALRLLLDCSVGGGRRSAPSRPAAERKRCHSERPWWVAEQAVRRREKRGTLVHRVDEPAVPQLRAPGSSPTATGRAVGVQDGSEGDELLTVDRYCRHMSITRPRISVLEPFTEPRPTSSPYLSVSPGGILGASRTVRARWPAGVAEDGDGDGESNCQDLWMKIF